MNKVFWTDINDVVDGERGWNLLLVESKVEDAVFGLADGESGEVKSYDAVCGVRLGDEVFIYVYKGAYWDCVDESAEDFVKDGGVDFTACIDIIQETLNRELNEEHYKIEIAYARNARAMTREGMVNLAEMALKSIREARVN